MAGAVVAARDNARNPSQVSAKDPSSLWAVCVKKQGFARHGVDVKDITGIVVRGPGPLWSFRMGCCGVVNVSARDSLSEHRRMAHLK